MLPNSSTVLLILGACAIAGVALGFGVDWIISRIRRARRAGEANYANAERETGAAIAEDIDRPSPEQGRIESEPAQEYQEAAGTGAGDDDWLNDGVPEVSTTDIKSDDERWLNVESVEADEIPPDVYRQQDEEWLNAGTDLATESLEESSSGPADRPRVQFRQEGSTLDISLTFPRQQDPRPQQPTISIRIGLPSHLSARRAGGLYDLEITTDDLSARGEGLQDVTTVRPAEESPDQGRLALDRNLAGQLESPIDQSPSLRDSLATGPAVTEITGETRALLDDIRVRLVEGPLAATPPLLDSLSVGPAGARVAETHPLMDEIRVKPSEGPIAEATVSIDSMLVESAESRVAESHPLMDEITVRPSPGPIEIDYDLIDDLITKRSASRTRMARPAPDATTATPPESPVKEREPSDEPVVVDQTDISVEAAQPAGGLEDRPFESPVQRADAAADATITRPTEGPLQSPELTEETATTRAPKSPDQKAEAIQQVSITEITEFLKEKRSAKLGDIPSVARDSRGAALQAPAARGVEIPKTRTEGISISEELLRAGVRTLATLRIYNRSEFYVQDTNLTGADSSQGPENGSFTLKVLNTPAELDELVRGGYDLAVNLRRIRRGLKKGMVAFLIMADKELASMGWACVTEGSKSTFKSYPYNRDLDKEACIVGEWTNPRFLHSGAATLVRNRRHQLLRDKGFTFERSLADAGTAGNRWTQRQNESQSNYRRRTYANLSLPGLFGVETWKERSLDEADPKPPYQMTTLLVLVLPLPPRAGDLARESNI